MPVADGPEQIDLYPWRILVHKTGFGTELWKGILGAVRPAPPTISFRSDGTVGQCNDPIVWRLPGFVYPP